jgi:hypothetical protein
MTDAVSRRYCPTRCINVDDASMGIRILANIRRVSCFLGTIRGRYYDVRITIKTYGYFIAQRYRNPIRIPFRYSDIYKGPDQNTIERVKGSQDHYQDYTIHFVEFNHLGTLNRGHSLCNG